MSVVGLYLRELRERRGVSLEEIARSTRVLHQYLEFLEADDFASLPAPVFTKGFIRAYCQALGLPPDEAVTLYERRIGESRESAKGAGTPARPGHRAGVAAGDGRGEGPGRGAVLVSFVLLVILGVALFAVTLALQSGREERPERSVQVTVPQAPAPAAPPAPRSLAESPGAEQPQRPPRAQPVPGPAPSAATASDAAPGPAPPLTAGAVVSPYRLVARTKEPTWIRVRTADGRTSEETIPAGELREWVSNRPFVLSIGNAGGVVFELNGRPIPSLGASGAVITRLVLPPEAQ